jgi:hypothetical protein
LGRHCGQAEEHPSLKRLSMRWAALAANEDI